MKNKIRTANITLVVQAVIFGFAMGELWFLSQAIASPFHNYIQSSNQPGMAFLASAIVGIVVLFYFVVRGGIDDIRKLLSCNRIDLFELIILVGLGLTISVIEGGVGTSKYQEYVGKIQANQLMLLGAIPLIIGLIFIMRIFTTQTNRNESVPFFINDQPIKVISDDLLGTSENAARFAERVLNGGSSDSLVFGIDAPWGIGKSSFINFCCEHWKSTANSKTIVCRFEPLRYKDGTDLVDKFVTELVDSIQEHAFIPSIHLLFSKYLGLIKGTNDFTFLGIKFGIQSSAGSVDDTLKNLEHHLSELNRKVIIIVDDLDRLGWAEVKNILFAIKRSFMLPNISYVLCYDTENLGSLEKHPVGDAEKVKEFLEKFVNVKISLFLDSSNLAKFVSSNIDQAINNNLQLDVHLLDQIQQALQSLVAIYKSDKYIYYQELIGDVRKIKRLINTMMLFDIQKTDFVNSDFNKDDLIHLMLIYINYPNIFRKIYNAETGGKSGLFSLKANNTTNGSDRQFINTSEFQEFKSSLPNNNQIFLLDQIFNPDKLADYLSDDATLDTTSRACFNGDGGTSRNLERYLDLIVKLSKQENRDAYRFYVNNKNNLLQGTPINEIFDKPEFSFSDGDFSREQLWNVIANSAYEIKPVIASSVVVYLMENLPDYSFFDAENVGARSRANLVYCLLKLLDKAAWGTGITGRRNNSDINVSEISEWVFGEDRHAQTGVINTLSRDARGILGLYDLLLFRLYCSADRGSSLFNLQRAISLHANPDVPRGGQTIELAKTGMRQISQLVFNIFRTQYIAPEINIFEMVDRLSLDDLAGETASFVHSQIAKKVVNHDQVDVLIAQSKSQIKSFVIYQLGNSMISSGIGCGYYDVAGDNDDHGIAIKINDYLFDHCFNPAINLRNYEYFLDYLLLNLAHNFFEESDDRFKPNLDEFLKVLHEERLALYWSTHRKEILESNFISMSKSVITGNYIATYEGDLPAVYQVLDQLIRSKQMGSESFL